MKKGLKKEGPMQTQAQEKFPCCSLSKHDQSVGGSQERNALIEKKAYELYEKRGRQHGLDWEDWLEAEKTCGID